MRNIRSLKIMICALGMMCYQSSFATTCYNQQVEGGTEKAAISNCPNVSDMACLTSYGVQCAKDQYGNCVCQ